MNLFYRALTYISYPLLVLIIFIRSFLNKEDSKRYKEKIFSSYFNVKKNGNRKLIWFHAASVGELKSIFSLVDQLNKKEKFDFLITTITLSSANLAEKKFGKLNNFHHRFLPVDVKFLIEKFLDLWEPSAIFLVDSEIWPNLIFTANEKKIPLAIINARITLKTYKRWSMIPVTAQSIFKLFDLCLTSNQETKQYLQNFKSKNVSFIGNIKFCEKINKKIKDTHEDFLLSKNFWLAASTHNGEENFCLETHLYLKDKITNLLTIIAPRHINRSKEIKKLCEKYNLNSQILNAEDTILNDREIIIINSYGILERFFKNAKSVFIGKSTVKRLENVGGQSPIEAAKLGCKIYHGPYIYNFKEVYEILNKNSVSKEVKNSRELANNLILDFNTKLGKNFEFSKSVDDLGEKILSQTMIKINNFLENEYN